MEVIIGGVVLSVTGPIVGGGGCRHGDGNATTVAATVCP